MAQARMRSARPTVSRRTGQNIRRLRTERGWTCQELSYQIRDLTRDDPDGPEEISPAVLRVMEGGGEHVRRITVDEAELLAAVFDVTIDDLTGEEE